MRLRDHYDWVALGDDPGALLSASLAAKLGLSVLVLPFCPASELAVAPADERSGADRGERADESVLDRETNYVPGLGAGGLWELALLRAGMTAQEQALILAAPAVPQIVTPTRRLQIEPDRERFAAELVREFGADTAEQSALAKAIGRADPVISEFWMKLSERLTVKATRPDSARKKEESLTLAKISEQLGRVDRENIALKTWYSSRSKLGVFARNAETGAEFLEFMQGVQPAVTGTLASLDIDLFSISHLFALSRSGAAFRGGMSGFREFLLKLARRNGADLPPKTECRRIFVQNGRFAGVLPSIRGSMIAANGGVLGVPLEKAQSILTFSGRGWTKATKKPLKAAGWKFTISLALHPEAIPPGMARRVIWQENGAPFLEIERVSPSEYGLKNRHHVLLFLRTVMPMTEESLTPSFQRLISARLLRKAVEISPFLEYHIRKIFPDFRSESGRELNEIYGFKSLGEIPQELLCYQGKGLGAQSSIEGLFLSSKESFPEMGLHGSAISALEGVAWAAHRSGLAGPFKD